MGFPNCSRMNVTNPPRVARAPMYPFKYNRSRHSTSNVTCPLNNSGILAIPRFYEISLPYARRFEVEDLASNLDEIKKNKLPILESIGTRKEFFGIDCSAFVS